MGNAIIQVRIMPSSPEVNLSEIEQKVRDILNAGGAINAKFEQEPIAFGLKAVIVSFMWPEEKELEEIEQKLKNIENVQSAEITDMRRAIG